MLQVRKYQDYALDEITRTIRGDVTRDGYSEGWEGDLVILDALKDMLHPEGIRYVDDMFGRWERVAAQD